MSRIVLLIIVVFCFFFAALYPSLVTHRDAIGIVFVSMAFKIWVEYLTGRTVSFFYAGDFPNEDKYKAARLIAFIGAFIPFSFGIYFLIRY